MKTIINHGTIASPQGLLANHKLLIEDGMISGIMPVDEPVTADRELDAQNNLIAPGFIDLHTHGAAGYNFISANHEQLDKIGIYFSRFGVTRYLATLMETEENRFSEALERFATYHPAEGAAIPIGVHLEGPYLSPDYPGDMGTKNVRLPNPAEYLPWLESELVKMITVAPELPGSIEFIHAARENDVVVSIGHGAPNETQVQAAFDAGASQISHMFNQMLGLNHHQAGLVDAALLNDAIALQIIADEDHLHPVTMQVLTRLKTPDLLILITDSTEENGTNILNHANEKALPGMLTMDQAIRNMIHNTKATLYDALQMASTSPAKSLGLCHQFGVLQPGTSADLVILDEHMQVQKTIINGKIAFNL